MKSKTDKRFFFETDLNWIGDKKGILTSKDTHGPIYVNVPPEFGGVEKDWTPEHLFLSAISSCYMTTFLLFVNKMNLELSHFECKTIGEIEMVNGKYQFSKVDLYPKIFVTDTETKQKIFAAIEKANKYCIVSNSINASIFYHTEIIIEALRRNKVIATNTKE